MKKIIAGILNRGYTTSKQASLGNCIAFLYPLKYILEDSPMEDGMTVRCNHNPFWAPENIQKRSELIRDIQGIHRRNIMDGRYFHILNRFENGDRYGIVIDQIAATIPAP